MKATKQTTNGTTLIAEFEDEKFNTWFLVSDKATGAFRLATLNYSLNGKPITRAAAGKLMTQPQSSFDDGITEATIEKKLSRTAATKWLCRAVINQNLPGLKPVATKGGVLLKLAA